MKNACELSSLEDYRFQQFCCLLTATLSLIAILTINFTPILETNNWTFFTVFLGLSLFVFLENFIKKRRLIEVFFSANHP